MMLRSTKPKHLVPKDTEILADSSYQGLEKIHEKTVLTGKRDKVN